MEFKKFNKSHLILLTLVCSIIAIALLSANSIQNFKTNNSPNIMSSRNQLKSSAEPFELTQDFEASTYFISPYTSPGVNDGVHFSFMGNKDGNYTIQIENYPAFLTDTSATENYVSFENPSGTNLRYIGFSEMDTFTFGQFNFKILISEDEGKSWATRQVKSIYPNITEILDYANYVSGNALAVNPDTGFIAMFTWINLTYLTMFRSFDNGTTWSDPLTVTNSTEMGAESNFEFGQHARIDAAILENGSIVVVSEADDPNSNPLVYIQSDDNNGTDWCTPKNVTCSIGSTKAQNPKLQVDRTSGDFWLMWRDNKPGLGKWNNETNRWAEFKQGECLSDNNPYKNASAGMDLDGSMDFYYDHVNGKWRFTNIEYNSLTTCSIDVWSCSDFITNSWTKEALGIFSDLGNLYASNFYMNYIYDGQHKLMFVWDYLGNDDIYQYTVLKNRIFWRQNGDFEKDVLEQVYWNGRKLDMNPIPTSLVKVFFMENHTRLAGLKSLFIILDNEKPSIMQFLQERYYFNPQSSNITLTKIPWEILPSETCNLFIEIFSEKTSVSLWNQIIENNWEDSDPKIFYSDQGILYVLYQSLESGRKIIYLIKSYDMGISWSDPVKIYDTTGYIPSFVGAAKGDLVFICIHENEYFRYLYRSFDQGVSFQEPINLYDANLFPIEAGYISDIEISNNGTMFITYRNDTTQFIMLRSSDLGINWTISKNFPGNSSMNINMNPKLAYNPINDLLHWIMPMDHLYPDYTKDLNISISTLNVSTNQYSARNSTGILNVGVFTQEPFIYITRENKTATPEIHVLYLDDIDFQNFIFHYKEYVSKDLGNSWIPPTDVESEIFSDVTTNLYEIFYIKMNTDGNDGELYFSRKGKLVRIQTDTLSSSFSEEITFNGIDDFGDYIDEGNYTYRIRLVDNAGNEIVKNGWFYADYNAPQINELSSNLNAPIPRYDLTITVNITHELNFTAYLHYQKDSGDWQKVRMRNSSSDHFSAQIPGDTTTNNVEYYVSATDLAGNEYILDNDGDYYSYGMPNFVWSSEGLFKEDKEYSSSKTYSFSITISNDIEYVREVIFRYSYDEGDSWDDLELEQTSPEFEGELDDIPGDLRELYYKVIIIDIYGNDYELTETQKIDFYPEVPSPEVDVVGTFFIIVISAAIGFCIAFGYIRLKKASHETIYQKIFLREYVKKRGTSKKLIDEKSINKARKEENGDELENGLEVLEKYKIATPFTMTYVGILCFTILVYSIGMLVALVTPPFGILLLAGSLLLGVFGYMILMSRDITINVYLEKIHMKNIFLEMFQMFFMFINIVTILLVGYTMDWFRYYLIESTFDFGELSIPRLYLSVIAVFFSSLVLVIITTYIQLRKTVYNLLRQRTQGATENLLLYLKDQNSSRLITYTGYKTIAFLVTILLAIVSTTNLLNNETGILLIIILIPFVIASFSALLIHRILEREKNKKQKQEIEMLFVDAKKFCTKCGEPAYLSDKFCGSCGAQQIFADMIGTYVLKCVECNSFINEKAKFCPSCGKAIENSTHSKMKK